jgi:hypothetical protein
MCVCTDVVIWAECQCLFGSELLGRTMTLGLSAVQGDIRSNLG